MSKRVPSRRRVVKSEPARTRSFACPDADWEAVEDFARRQGLGSASDAARVLLRTGLRTQRLVEELAGAQEWQVAQAWTDAQAIADGDRDVGSWDRISDAGERARGRVRARSGGRAATPKR